LKAGQTSSDTAKRGRKAGSESVDTSMVKLEEKPRQNFYKGNWIPSQKPTIIIEGIEQILRDAGVPDSQVAIAVMKI
jgi:hypothetical protein